MKKSETIYQRAKRNGATLIATCVGINIDQWNALMKGARDANSNSVIEIAYQAGVIDLWTRNKEKKEPYFNPYTHKVTRTHIIYINSGIEHFIKVH